MLTGDRYGDLLREFYVCLWTMGHVFLHRVLETTETETLVAMGCAFVEEYLQMVLFFDEQMQVRAYMCVCVCVC